MLCQFSSRKKKNLYLSLNHKNAPQCFQEAKNSHFPGPKRISVSPDATTETATGFSNPLWAHCWPELFARSPVRGCSRLAVGGGRKWPTDPHTKKKTRGFKSNFWCAMFLGASSCDFIIMRRSEAIRSITACDGKGDHQSLDCTWCSQKDSEVDFFKYSFSG